MKKIFKSLGLGFIALALIVGVGASSASAVTLTLGAGTAVSDGALTLNGTSIAIGGSGIVTTMPGTLSITGAPVGSSGALTVTSPLSATGSVFQAAIKGRADVAATFGSDVFREPAVAWGIRGEVVGSNLTKLYNYVAGVTGKYNITGTNASQFPKAGVLGIIDNQTTTGDAAIMAELDGDGGVTTARAGYGIMVINSTSASGFTYGMDLKLQTAPSGEAGFSQAFKVADIRLSSGAEVKTGASTGPSTDVACAVVGSLYTSTNDGQLWRCTVIGAAGAATWVGSTASSKPYAMFYGLTTGTGNDGDDDYAATVAVKTGAGTGRVPFPRNGAADGIVRVNTTSFTLPNIGTYEVTFNVGTTEPGQLQLELGGTALAYTTAVGIGAVGGANIGGTFFVTTTGVNQVLAVINPAGNTPALTITPAAGNLTHAKTQSLTIKQL